jgi:hypothetical protein
MIGYEDSALIGNGGKFRDFDNSLMHVRVMTLKVILVRQNYIIG